MAETTPKKISDLDALTTPQDTDVMPVVDNSGTPTTKKSTWANIKATLKTYFDTLYQAALGYTAENSANKKTTLADDSDTYYPSQKAVKTAVDAKADKGANSDITSLSGLTTALSVDQGGTGQATAQAAIDALTNVSAATNEHVLTKDTATGNAIFKAASGGANTALSNLADVAINTTLKSDTDNTDDLGAPDKAWKDAYIKGNIGVSGAAIVDGVTATTQPAGDNSTKLATTAYVYESMGRKNALINGRFKVAQRGTTFTSATVPANSDDTYLLDRWILLSDGNDIVDVSQEATVVPVGSGNAIKLDVETANKKFGIIQIIENKDAINFIGGTVSLQFKARKTGTTINAIRAGVISWSSTADTVTSDVVDAWGNAGTNPTLVANWTFENTPEALSALTTDYQTYKIENIAIDTASTTNIAVFIWVDDTTMDVGDLLYITDVQLEYGTKCTEVEIMRYQQEVDICSFYYTILGEMFGYAFTTTAIQALAPHHELRSAPQIELRTLTPYGESPISVEARNFSDATTTGSVLSKYSSSIIRIDGTTGMTAGTNAKIEGGDLALSAEL